MITDHFFRVQSVFIRGRYFSELKFSAWDLFWISDFRFRIYFR
jgi:hypothetical protein